MSTLDYIPPPKDLEFLPHPPPLEEAPSWVLEIGPGKGELLLHLASTTPHIHFIGLEIKKGRFEKIAKKARRLELNNLYMVRGDARECLPRFLSPGLLEKIYILFPDPWPKKRHAKHRLLKPRLIQQLHHFLKEGGEVYSATDAGFYAEQILESFQEAGGFKAESIESLFPTYFETKWRGLGRKVQYWR